MTGDRVLMFSFPYYGLFGAVFKRKMKSLVMILRKIWTKMHRPKNEMKGKKLAYFLQNH